MEGNILLGQGTELRAAPEAMWKQHLRQVPQHSGERLSFMTQAHHRVRYFVVRRLAEAQHPLTPDSIAAELEMPLAQVAGILDELERKLFFLARNAEGAVSWAYPVTVEPTPHRLAFSTGERLYGA
jgi:hypothetical protein